MVDPIESVRRLHLQQTLTPPVPAPRKSIRLTNQTLARLYANQEVVQRTQSLDDSHKCRCNCTDWLLHFDNSLHIDGISAHNSTGITIDERNNNCRNGGTDSSKQTLDLLTGNEGKGMIIAPTDQTITSTQQPQPSANIATSAEELAQIFTNQSISGDLFVPNTGAVAVVAAPVAKCLSLVTGNGSSQISASSSCGSTTSGDGSDDIYGTINASAITTGASTTTHTTASTIATTDRVINESIAINNKFNHKNNSQNASVKNNSYESSDSRSNDTNVQNLIQTSHTAHNSQNQCSTVPPIIDLLKEFDICFNSDTNSENTESKNLIQFSTTDNTISVDLSQHKQSQEGRESKGDRESVTTTTTGSVYEYDSIKLEKESIDTKASIGVADLDNTDNSSRVELKDYDLICLDEEPEEVHRSLLKYRRGPLCFDSKCITLKRRIGNGYFGDVFLATIPSTSSSAVIQLAVKMLKTHASIRQKAEILREAQVMSKLDHKHIVRLIGVCSGEPFMLVMELAPLGPLNRYLCESGAHMSDDCLLKLMLQVSGAMKYLEDKCFVHRDLAARNVLLVSERFAKVSDFGMSRALSIGKDYYKARSASKWPLKWYAPECIYYYKFSSKSDVWSYGVTLWEVMSRGEMPYQGMDGQDILRMFKESKRLSKPDKCPVIIYQLMWNCWHFRPEDRLNFTQICDQLSRYLQTRDKTE